jgi:hypothetical protein
MLPDSAFRDRRAANGEGDDSPAPDAGSKPVSRAAAQSKK